MTTTKGPTGNFYADLEGDASPMACAPRHVLKAKHASTIASVRRVVLEALLSAGYEAQLAEKMADEVAKSLPDIQLKLTNT